jgi:hypothetical protein
MRLLLLVVDVYLKLKLAFCKGDKGDTLSSKGFNLSPNNLLMGPNHQIIVCDLGNLEHSETKHEVQSFLEVFEYLTRQKQRQSENYDY